MGGTILSAAAGLTAVLTGANHITLAGSDVRLGDVARVRGADAGVASEVIIARLAAGKSATLSREAIAQLVRRAVPSIKVVIGAGTDIILEAPTVGAVASRCVEAAAAIVPGGQISNKDVRAVVCSSTRTTAAVVRDHDRGIATAAAAIQPGDYLGQLLVTDAPPVARGDKLALVSKSGPVTIVRHVTALQSAAPEQRRLFVRTEDGSVFSAPIAAGASR
jgi:flagella basal body P-ring formation protein FlgA